MEALSQFSKLHLSCGAEEETLTHIFQCKNLQMTQTRAECIEVIKKAFQITNFPAKVAGPFLEMAQCLSNNRDRIMREKICLWLLRPLRTNKGWANIYCLEGF